MSTPEEQRRLAVKSKSPVVATWSKPNGSTMTLHASGELIGRIPSGRLVRINMRAAGNYRRTRWTVETAELRAAEYGFTRDEEEL